MASATAISRFSELVDVPLRDGSTVHVRPVVAADRDGIARLLRSMSPDSRYFRGCGEIDVDWLSDWSADVDGSDRYGLVVTSGASKEILAHAAYARIDQRRAEVAFEVTDALHGHGIGSLLLAQLAGIAAQHGVEVFVASVMSSNYKMLEVFAHSGFPVTEEWDSGMVEVAFPTAMSAPMMLAA